jgi:hypothetical protein
MVMTPAQCAGTLAANETSSPKVTIQVRSRTYEIAFSGQAGTTVRAEFDDCQITLSPDRTTLHAELPDQPALIGLIQRIVSLRLELVHVLLVPPGTPTGQGPNPQEE